ncbi:TetR/AcrR family transcriptional regulator [Chryseobacterium scophthalmum]|uniref:TetR/AcrR family transcriptional regulator n=1 Tax=Chryseobacterium scophthalmum TaxID=59733 RepID=UPI001AEBF961|nr:TetR/AcrR family transcriptional regulator [Chryseobacterium scophthalmum]
MTRAEITRSNILQSALMLTYRQGYQATSIDEILEKTQVTKGAFYYHFRNKNEMGMALISEALNNEILPFIEKSLSKGTDFKKNMYQMMHSLLLEHPFMNAANGCPTVNLIQEMAPLSDAFRKALLKSLNKWRKAIEDEITRSQTAGQLSLDHDAKKIAIHILTQYHGVRNMGKILGKRYYYTFLKEFKIYIDSLD